MATIDQLNFEVILDDKEFNAKVKEDIRLANELNTSLSQLLTIKNKVGKFTQDDVNNNRKANKILEDNAKTQEKITREKDKTRAMQDKLNASIQRATKSYQVQSRILNELKGYALGYLSVHGASQLLSSLVRVTGEFELQKTTLAAMIGDLNTAENIIARIQGLAVESPFQFKELTTYAKQLSAFSVPAQELYDTTKMLADVSAGLGVGMDRIVLAYGQVRSAAFLRGQEVRQFTEAGIPILDELAKQFTELEGRAVSTGEVFDKISARLVPFEMVAKVFKDMTSEGGKFYNMQEVQAETLKGKLSNLKDAYEVMLNEIGKSQSENLKGAVDWVKRLMVNYEDVGRSLVSLISTYGIFRTILGVVGADHIKLAARVAKLTKTYANFSKLLAANPYGALVAGLTALGFAIHRAAKEQTAFEKSTEITKNTLKEYNKNVASEKDLLKYLLDRLSKLTVGTSEYNEVKSQILSNYGQYLSEVDKENLAVGNLAGMYEKLAKSIIEANRQKALQRGNDKLTQQFTTEYDAIFAKFDATIKALGIESKAVRTALSDFVRGEIGLEDLPEEAYNAVREAQERINAAVSAKGGMFGSGVSFAGYDFELLKSQLQSVNEIIDESRERLATDLRVIYGPMPSEKTAEKLVEGWRKDVQELLTKMGLNEGSSFGLWAKDTTKATDYIDDMIKRYKELNKEIKRVSSFDPEYAATLKKELAAIEAVSKKLNVDIKNLAANKGDTTESKEERRIKRLVDALRTLQNQYEKLKIAGASDESIKKLFEGLYPELIDEQGKEFVTDLKYLERAKNLIEQLHKLAPDDAKKLLVDLGEDEFSVFLKNLDKQNKAYKDAASAAKEYFNLLRKWEAEDTNIEGGGVAFDISKISSDLSAKINAINLKTQKTRELFAQIGISDTDKRDKEAVKKMREIFEKEFGEGSWDKFYQEYLSKGESAFKILADKEKKYEKQIAQEKINGLAKAYVNENIGGIDLSHWGDKNLSQIKSIGDQIVAAYKDIDKNGIKLTENQKQRLSDLGLTTEELIEAIKQILSGNYEESTIEKFKKIQGKAQDVVSILGEASSAISTLGDAAENDLLMGFGELINSAKQFTDIILDCDALWESMAESSKEITDEVGNIAQSNDWITMIIKVVLLGIEKIAQSISNTNAFLNFQKELLREYAEVEKDISFNRSISLFDTIFGKNSLGRLKATADAAKDIIKDVIDLSKTAVTWSGKEVFSWLETDPGWWQSTFAGGGQIEKFELDQLFDERGLLSDEGFKKLEAFYNSKRLTKEAEAKAEELLNYYERYKEATESVAETIDEVFNSLATDIADNMIASFIEIGDATADLARGFDNVRQSIGRMIMESALVEAMRPAIEEVTNAFNSYIVDEDYGKFASDINVALSGLEGVLNSDAWNELAEVLQTNNLLGTTEKTSSSLSEGIKGITEDQANLLASYLNAIRADVSYSKALWTRMDANLQRIADMFASSPTLMEYQAQIAANTFDTAQATQAILGELRSVMTSEGGDTAIRIYS